MEYLKNLSPDTVLRMSVVKRWAIIDTSRDQSLAEHSFNVSIISLWLLERMANIVGTQLSDSTKLTVLLYGLLHDSDETLTGDIPSDIKGYLSPALKFVSESLHPLCVESWYTKVNGSSPSFSTADENLIHAIVKLADMIDARRFAEAYVVTRTDRGNVLPDISNKLLKAAANVSEITGLDTPTIMALAGEWTTHV